MNRRSLAKWLLEVHVDRRWYELRRSPEPIPAPGRPRTIALDPAEFPDQVVVVGRGSLTAPVDVDLRPDTGVSRQHARLDHADGQWWVTDLDSNNGTWLSTDETRLPRRRLTTRTKLVDGMSLFVGSWTRLVLRRVDRAPEPLPQLQPPEDRKGRGLRR